MTKKVKYGILIRKKITNLPSDAKIARFFADVITFNEDDGKPRNFRFSSVENKDYQFFDGLTATCHISDDDTEPYGYRVEYFSPYTVEQKDAERMYKTLKKINNKMKKFENEFGSHKSFGEYVSRFAKAVGAKVVVFYEDFDNAHSNYTYNNFLEYKPGKAVEIVDEFVDKEAKKLLEHKILSGRISS